MIKSKHLLKKIILFFFIALFFTIFFLGKENISPFKTDWLFSQLDLSNHYAGWHFFNNDNWRFPLGLNPNYGTANNSIIYSDSIPIMAFLFKTLKPFVESDYNYFGFWIFLCFFLQGIISYKLIFKFTQNKKYSFIASLFFLTAPIFLHKMTHVFSLSAHFLILASIYILNMTDKKKFLYWLGIGFFSVLIHFYLYFIISIIFFIDLSNDFLLKEKKIKKYLKLLSLYLIFSLFLMYIAGYFTINSINSLALGYGYFKFNLLGFFDPIQITESGEKSSSGFSSWSLFVTDLPSFATEYEGFSYLGLGVIGLLIYSIFNYFQFKKNLFLQSLKNIYLLIFILFFMLSLSNNIDFGRTPIIHFELNKYILAALGIIRSTGRLIWPAYYLILLFIFIYSFRKNENKQSTIIIIIALIFQLIDISPGLRQIANGKYFSENRKLFVEATNELDDKNWLNLIGEPIIKTTLELGYNNLSAKTARFLSQNNIKSNIYALARYDRFLVPNNRYEIYDKIYSKNISNAPYIVDNTFNHILDISDRFKNDNLGFFYRNNIWVIQKDKKVLMNDSDSIFKSQLKFPILDSKINITSKDKEFFGIGWIKDQNYPNLIISDGNISSILFQIENPQLNELIFELDQNKINQDEIEFDIFINEKLIKSQKVFKDKTNSFKLNLKETNNKIIRIDLVFKDLKTQWKAKKNINSNKFGIFLKSIKLKKI